MRRFFSLVPVALLIGCLQGCKQQSPTEVIAPGYSQLPGMIRTSAWPSYGTMDTIPCESRWIEDTEGRTYVVYICYRPREKNDLAIGAPVYGLDGLVSEDAPREVIDRVVLAVRARPLGAYTYFELPKLLYRDVTNPNLGAESKVESYFTLVLWGRILIAYHSGGDGAGSYEVNWIIDLDKTRATRIVCPAYGAETSAHEWLDLTEIETPRITDSDEPTG